MPSMTARRKAILVLLWWSRVHGHNNVNAICHFCVSFQLHEWLVGSTAQNGNVNTSDFVYCQDGLIILLNNPKISVTYHQTWFLAHVTVNEEVGICSMKWPKDPGSFHLIMILLLLGLHVLQHIVHTHGADWKRECVEEHTESFRGQA